MRALSTLDVVQGEVTHCQPIPMRSAFWMSSKLSRTFLASRLVRLALPIM